jgi:hypothetical protein
MAYAKEYMPDSRLKKSILGRDIDFPEVILHLDRYKIKDVLTHKNSQFKGLLRKYGL